MKKNSLKSLALTDVIVFIIFATVGLVTQFFLFIFNSSIPISKLVQGPPLCPLILSIIMLLESFIVIFAVNLIFKIKKSVVFIALSAFCSILLSFICIFILD